MSLMAYANPEDIADEKKRADGYGIARFKKSTGEVTFECWPRFTARDADDRQQFPGWPITIKSETNDGRKPSAWLPEIAFDGASDPVISVIEEKSGDILYTIRARGDRHQPAVFAPGRYTIKAGRDKPDQEIANGVEAKGKEAAGKMKARIE